VPLKLIKDLDSVPFPARYLVKKYNYGSQYNPKIRKKVHQEGNVHKKDKETDIGTIYSN